jgi:hypothetical protein
MTRRTPVWGLIVLAALAGCNRHQSAAAQVEPYIADEASVGFDLEALPVAEGPQQWIATYTSQGKTARFRIELGPARGSAPTNIQGLTFKSGSGKFLPEAGSDASVLLADLQKALQAKILPKSSPAKSSVSFEFVNLGENLSQGPGGGFNENPIGNWTTMKLFFGEGDQESEVFLNLNPKSKKGQFSIKDSDYGDLVLAALAKVL